MHTYCYDEEEEQGAGDGMFSSAVCRKPWLVCLK